jgi:hypothetical protein
LTGIVFGSACAETDRARPGSIHRPGIPVMP